MATIVLAVLFAIVALPAAVLAHELGHWAGARLMGLPVARVRLGPVVRDQGRWHASLRNGAIGSVTMDFERTDARRLRARAGVAIVAGPTAGLAFAAAAVLASLLWGWPYRIGAALVVVNALADLVPVSLGLSFRDQFRSDGMLLWKWLTAPAEAASWTAVGALETARRADRRPRDWSPEWVTLATTIGPTTAARAYGWYLAFTSVLDCGEVERARKLLDAVFAARELLPAQYRCHVSGWMAFAVARYDAGVDRAHEIVSAVPDWSRAKWLWYLATAAASLAAGRPHVQGRVQGRVQPPARPPRELVEQLDGHHAGQR